MRRRLLSKPFIIGIVVVLIAAGAGAFLLTRGDPASVSYRTGVATLGTVTQTVSLSGNLAPDGETDLDFEGGGKVTSVNVQPGQTVTAGEVLATQDPTTVDDSLTQANATLAGAEANLALARRNLGVEPVAGRRPGQQRGGVVPVGDHEPERHQSGQRPADKPGIQRIHRSAGAGHHRRMHAE